MSSSLSTRTKMPKYQTIKCGLVIPREDNWAELEKLRIALVTGNLNELKTVLKQGITPDEALRGDWSPLMYACSLGHHDITEFLLKNGANPNYHKGLLTPLMAACTSGRDEGKLLECVKLLLLYGADINTGDHFNVTALMFAAREGNLHIVEYLIKNNANIYMRDNRGWTALFWAINSGRTAVIKYLLKAESTEYLRSNHMMPKHGPHKPNKENNDFMNGEKHRGRDEDSEVTDKNLSLQDNSDLSNHGENNHDYSVKLMSEMEVHLYQDLYTISLMRLNLRDATVHTPMEARHLSCKTRGALRASECVYHQMRFLHHFTTKLSETDDVIPADFIVEKNVTVNTQTWSTIIITSVVVAITLWKTNTFSQFPSIESLTGM